MKAYHTEGGSKGEQPPEMEIKCVAGGELISVIYNADHEEIKNIRKLFLVNHMWFPEAYTNNSLYTMLVVFKLDK